MIDNYELGLVGLTAANGYFLIDEGSRLDKIVLATTGMLVVDSVVTPWFTGGQTLHEMLGLSAGSTTDLKIYLYERGATAIGNIYMTWRNLSNYIGRI